MRYNAVRKFGRAVSNILYGYTELPATLIRTTDRSASEFAHGVTAGTGRSFARVGWGFFELVTFPFKTYKGSYRTPFRKNIYFNPIRGYEEFPPELGFLSSSHYVRETRF